MYKKISKSTKTLVWFSVSKQEGCGIEGGVWIRHSHSKHPETYTDQCPTEPQLQDMAQGPGGRSQHTEGWAPFQFCWLNSITLFTQQYFTSQKDLTFRVCKCQTVSVDHGFLAGSHCSLSSNQSCGDGM